MYEQESQRVHHIFMQQTLIDDRYALSNLLGSGGMAKVYLAHDDVLDRDVALKVLRDQYVKHEEFFERFTAPCSEVGPLRIRNGQCLLGRSALRDDRRYGVQQAEERGRMGQYHCKPL